MITRIDRMQVAVRSRRLAVETWRRLFDVGVVREDRVPSLGAARTVLRLGESELELLEPDGLGAVAQHLSRSPTPIFAVGLAARDLAECRATLDARGVHHQQDGAQVWLLGEWLGVPGLRVVLTQDETREPIGLAARIYEATHLMEGCARAADRLAKVFDLDPANFVPIQSEQYGYRGILVRFRSERLDRIETVTPIDRSKPMGRFFARRGPCLYMFYLECAQVRALRTRLDQYLSEAWVGDRASAVPDNLFIPPQALHGILLGVSRETVAWRWSGYPEKVRGAG